jgi:hypothetical protein
MGQFDHVIDWFKNHHDAVIDDLEPMESGRMRMMEFDGSEWRDVTPQLIAETRRRIAELEVLVNLYEGRNNQASGAFQLVAGRDRRARPK